MWDKNLLKKDKDCYLKGLVNEDDLVQKMVSGDTKAFAELYDFYKGKVFAFAWTLTKSKENAQDAVQEIFFKIWNKRDQIDASLSFEAYLRQITFNHVVSFFRKVKQDQNLLKQLKLDMDRANVHAEELYASKELLSFYQQAIQKLPPQTQKAYLLSREAMLTYEEIAIELRVSKNTIRNQIAHSIRFIKQYVIKHGEVTGIFIFFFLVASSTFF